MNQRFERSQIRVERSRIREAAEILSDSSTEVDRWERLIATAPDLLAALETVMAWWLGGSGPIPLNPYAMIFPDGLSVIEHFRAAIRKAKGESA